MMKRRFYLGLLAAVAVLCSACHDNIFETIEEEVELSDAGIEGTVSSIVEFKGYLYLSAGHSGEIYRKEISNTSRKNWQSLSVIGSSYYPIYLYSDASTLHMVAYTYEDDDGYNSPTFFESHSSDGTSWGSPNKLGDDTNYIPAAYKDKYISVEASNGKTYSISSGDGGYDIYMDGTKIYNTDDDDTGRIWAITATKDFVIIGANQGLYRMRIKDDGTLEGPSESFAGSGAKSIFGGFRCYVVYIPETYRAKNEGDAPIYVYMDRRGGSYTSKQGLYAYYPGNGWDKDGTDSSSGN